jgi:hypothetical protein
MQEELAERMARIEAHLKLPHRGQEQKTKKARLPSVKKGNRRGKRA